MIIELIKLRKLGRAAFNKELMNIYNEVFPTFYNIMKARYSARKEDCEEAFNDALLAFYNAVRTDHYDETKGSIEGFLTTTGRNKLIDIIRKAHPERQIETPIEEMDVFLNISDDTNDEEDERESIVANIVKRLEEPCRKILFMFYYDRASMKDIAHALDYKSSDVAKSKKNVCMNKVKAVAECDFNLRGL